MFTGLIDGIGSIKRITTTRAGRELVITCQYEDLTAGESVSVNGACLTVRDCGRKWFSAAASETTLQRTAIGAWTQGLRVNLERAMRADSRLGGHLVQGHVDGIGRVLEARMSDDAWLVDVAAPPDVAELFVPLGSVAIDGVSLTVNELPGHDVLQVSVIEYTRRHTTLGELRPGMPVHLEADIIAKYVYRMLALYRPAPA